MNKSTIIAGVGVLVFVVIMGVVVVVNSNENELGRVYNNGERVGTAKGLEKILSEAAITSGEKSEFHRALEVQLGASSDAIE